MNNKLSEQAIIGRCLTSPDEFHKVRGILEADFFLEPTCQMLWQCMEAIVSRGEDIDTYLVNREASKRSGQDRNIEYLKALKQAALSNTDKIEAHAAIVADQGHQMLLRKLQAEVANLPSENVDESLSILENKVLGIRSIRTVDVEEDPREITKRLLHNYDNAHTTGSSIVGICTGYAPIDNLTRGHKPNELIILAAPAGTGKTTFGLNLMLAPLELGMPVAIYSTEMEEDEQRLTIACIRGKQNQVLVFAGQGNRAQLKKDLEWLEKAPLHIRYKPGLDLDYLKSQMVVDKSKYGIKMAMVDHIHGMTGKEKDSFSKISNIAVGLKILAGQLNIPVLGVSQVSRSEKGTTDKAPSMRDLRGSGLIEEQADRIFAMWRPGNNEVANINEIVHLHVLKNRRGGGLGKFVFLHRLCNSQFELRHASDSVIEKEFPGAYNVGGNND